jgi:hypothetical protein
MRRDEMALLISCAVCEPDESRRMPDRVTREPIGHIFAGVTRAGEASRRPYEEKFKCCGACQQSQIAFETVEFGRKNPTRECGAWGTRNRRQNQTRRPKPIAKPVEI